MERHAMQTLMRWKDSDDRKPLVLKGARQVGKTWLMREFGRRAYAHTVYLNFDEEDALRSIFETNKDPQRIIELLSLIVGQKIQPRETLIIFDEVQECPQALNALKYFKEKAPDYHIIAAGSLLGTLLAQPKSYPVGMVNLLELGPMTFAEFLAATNASLHLYYQTSPSKKSFIASFSKPTTTTSSSAACPNASHPGSATKTPPASSASSMNSSPSMKTIFQSTTAASIAAASSWSFAASSPSSQSQTKSLSTAP